VAEHISCGASTSTDRESITFQATGPFGTVPAGSSYTTEISTAGPLGPWSLPPFISYDGDPCVADTQPFVDPGTSGIGPIIRRLTPDTDYWVRVTRTGPDTPAEVDICG
jgi:hypothetical protein